MMFKRPHNNTVSAVFTVKVQDAVSNAAYQTKAYLARQYHGFQPYAALPALWKVPTHELDNWYEAILYCIGNMGDLSARERSDAQYLAWLELNRHYEEEVQP